MLKEIIENLRQTMPKAFLNKGPTIPWMDQNVRALSDGIPEGNYGRRTHASTLWIDPEYQPSADDQRILGDVNRIGTEALAWYVSFHQNRRWGIYFRLRGLAFLAGLFMAKNPAIEANECMKRAYDVLFQHEFFHFLTDMTAVHMEMVYQKPIYNDYLSYLNGYTSKSFQIEEPLANACALRRSHRRFFSCIKDFFSQQPSPYSTYGNFVRDTDFLEGKRKLGLILRIHDDSLVFPGILEELPDIAEPRWEFLYNVTPEKLFLPEIPIWLVIEKDHPTSSIKFVTPIFMGTKIAAHPCREHGPPHLHIWIPADNRRDGRYLYPSLQPYMNAKPLSNRERKKVEEVIGRFREKIERDLIGFKVVS